MKKIRYLIIHFSTPLITNLLPSFRGAIAKLAGLDSTLFHNHIGDTDYRFKYPLIQYKLVKGRPMLVCIEEAIEELDTLFANENQYLDLQGIKYPLTIERISPLEHTLQVWDTLLEYKITNWIALNTNNYTLFQTMDTVEKQNEMLANILKANILSMAKGIDWNIEKEIQVIVNAQESKWAKDKQNNILIFQADFLVNIYLPLYWGIGKSSSKGFGILHQIKNK